LENPGRSTVRPLGIPGKDFDWTLMGTPTKSLSSGSGRLPVMRSRVSRFRGFESARRLASSQRRAAFGERPLDRASHPGPVRPLRGHRRAR
jgi:hypothetical protein